LRGVAKVFFLSFNLLPFQFPARWWLGYEWVGGSVGELESRCATDEKRNLNIAILILVMSAIGGRKIDLSLCNDCDDYLGNNVCGYATCGCNIAISQARGICKKLKR